MMATFLKTIAWVSLIGAVLLGGYLWRLDREITSTFEGRRWSVPAIVYAQPLELYPGMAFSTADLITELDRLGYERTATAKFPGSYSVATAQVRVHLRAAQFVEGTRASQQVLVSFTGLALASLQAADGKAEPLIRLDPPVIGSFFPSHGEDRLILTPEQVPPLLRDTLKSVEDKNFDAHHGFDLRGIARAFWVNIRARKVSQGGSTLTQQLVKSYFLDNRRTLARKLKEVAMAIILEIRFTKEDLLNAYINEIFIGQAGIRAIHGFGLGAQFYFNRPLSELSVAQIATLVTIIRGPSYYNPFKKTERVTERRNRVLTTMHRDGLIADAQLAVAINAPLDISRGARRGGTYYPAFMDLVRRELDDRYAETDLASRGLRIFTTLAPRQQDNLEAEITSRLAELEHQRDLEVDSLQAAAVISDTQTGEVLALAGGRHAGIDGFNRALHSKRPMGSLVKPVIYLLAFEDGAHLATPVQDSAVRLELPGDQVWAPQNFDEQEHGQVPLIRALGDSLNLATVNLGLKLGVDRVAKRLQDVSAMPTSNVYPSLLLGAEPRSPLQISQLYGTFASGGFQTAPKSVIAVLDEQGQSLSHHAFTMSQQVPTPIANQLNRGLQAVMEQGTGKTSIHASSGVAGKTGTSDDFRDSWFAGYDAQHLAVVWVGRDDNLPTALTGAAGAMQVWDGLMVRKGVKPLIRLNPNAEQPMDYTTGLMAAGQCQIDSKTLLQPINVPLPTTANVAQHPACSVEGQGRGFGKRLQRWLGGNGTGH